MSFFAAILLVSAQAGSATPAPPLAAPAATDPQALNYARQIASAMWPEGAYGKMMQQMMGGGDSMIDMMLDMSLVDMLGEEAVKELEKKAKPGEDPRQSMRELMRKQDPHYEERMKITMQVMGEEMARIFAPAEPKMREAMAQSFARRFSTEKLREVATFYNTPTGREFAFESMMAFTDKEMMKAMMSSMPDIVKQMPAIIEKLEKATAHLPPPPKKAKDKKTDDDA